MIIGDVETTEKVEYEDLLKNYYEKMEIIEEQDKEIERLKEDNEYLNKVNIELSTEKNRLNNKLELISMIVEREFPPNEFITYKMKKILKGSDKE